MRKRKIILVITITGIIAITGVASYCGWVIYSARQYTLNTILPKERIAHYPLQLASLSQRQLMILLKVQDPNFFNHHGVDLSTPGAGITTITQALVKHLYFARFRPGIAKLKQTLIAYFVLDPLMPKKMQLTRFINTVYIGPEAIGFEQAANFYFHKKFEQLTEIQYIGLVAMIIAPGTFNLIDTPKEIKSA